MKKIILFIFAVMMISTPALAGDTYLKINPSCTNADGQVLVDVIISGEDICSGSFNIYFDTEVLKPVNVEKGAILNGSVSTNNVTLFKKENPPDFFRINWSKTEALGNGCLCTITFDVLTKEKAICTLTFDDITLADSNGKYIAHKTIPVTHEAIPGKVYLNGLFADTEYSENGTTAAIRTNIYNGEKTAANTDVYIARYTANGSLIDVVKHTCETKAGEIISKPYSADIGGDVSYVKVFCWRNGLQPINLCEVN